MRRPCIAGRPETTECARCRYGTYTEGPNLLRHCFNQPQCDDGRRQIKRPGSIANRQECECKDGFYESPSGELCLPWTVCGVGYGVATPGSVTRDVVCEKCPAGTYSDQEDMTMPCFPHTNCEKLGLTILKNGTDSSDSVCTARAITPLPVTTVTVTRLPDDEGQGSSTSTSPPFEVVDVDQTAKENSDDIGFHGDTALTIRNEDVANWKMYFSIATAIFGLVITICVAIFIYKKIKRRTANNENDGDVAQNNCTTTTIHRRGSGSSVSSTASPLQEAEPASIPALNVSPQGPGYHNTVMGSSGRNGMGNDENGVSGDIDVHGDLTSIHNESLEDKNNLWNIHPESQMGSVTSLIRESSNSESGLDQEPLLQGSS
ncbi:tumor necrosis factor receptor superfamily member 1B-like [Ptychodera flava]|uniref:tumor necrosis factor receptor superfamily member 1B-like n=1 Tax=Ptychodera flava TaxID=63121 RepID=UPI003969F709